VWFNPFTAKKTRRNLRNEDSPEITLILSPWYLFKTSLRELAIEYYLGQIQSIFNNFDVFGIDFGSVVVFIRRGSSKSLNKVLVTKQRKCNKVSFSSTSIPVTNPIFHSSLEKSAS